MIADQVSDTGSYEYRTLSKDAKKQNAERRGIILPIPINRQWLIPLLRGKLQNYWHMTKTGRFVGESRQLCGTSGRQCNLFIGCKPHGRIPHHSIKTDHKYYYVITYSGSSSSAADLETGGCGFDSHQGQILFTCLYPLIHMRLERNYLARLR